jgi:hypothetical protein
MTALFPNLTVCQQITAKVNCPVADKNIDLEEISLKIWYKAVCINQKQTY